MFTRNSLKQMKKWLDTLMREKLYAEKKLWKKYKYQISITDFIV